MDRWHSMNDIPTQVVGPRLATPLIKRSYTSKEMSCTAQNNDRKGIR